LKKANNLLEEAMKKNHQAEIDRLNAEMDEVLKECKAEISEQKRIEVTIVNE